MNKLLAARTSDIDCIALRYKSVSTTDLAVTSIKLKLVSTIVQLRDTALSSTFESSLHRLRISTPYPNRLDPCARALSSRDLQSSFPKARRAHIVGKYVFLLEKDCKAINATVGHSSRQDRRRQFTGRRDNT